MIRTKWHILAIIIFLVFIALLGRFVVYKAEAKEVSLEASNSGLGAKNAYIRDIIVHEAKTYGVSTHLALSLAHVESGFRPEAKNPRSSALGLFQWIKSSWATFCTGERENPVHNARCAMKTISEGGISHWLADPNVILGLRKQGVSDEIVFKYSKKELALK